MSWRDKLQQGQFRGVVFQIASHDAAVGGRRVAVHEFVARDLPYAEDLGRATHEFSISGYVIGPDYMAQRDALIAACQKSGAGVLVHPFLGRLTVICTSLNIRESSDEGGMARFTLDCVEAGENRFPTATSNVAATLARAGTDARAAVKDEFVERFQIDGQPGFVAEMAAFDLATLKDGIRDAFSQFDANYLQGYRQLLQLPTPSDIFTDLEALVGSLVAGLDPQPALRRFGVIDTQSYQPAPFEPNLQQTPARQAQTQCQEALRTAGRHLILIAAAGRAAAAPLRTVEDADDYRALLTAGLDSEFEAGVSDAVFQSLSELYRQTVAVLGARRLTLPRTQTVQTTHGETALTLSWAHFGNVNATDDIVQLNDLAHPLFVPTGDVRIASGARP